MILLEKTARDFIVGDVSLTIVGNTIGNTP